jgi:3-deoxy-D-manno-octulosonic-acid transferase
MRTLYTIVMYLLTPVILYRLAVRGLRAPAYFGRWKERFGFFNSPGYDESIWVHAVSVGEFNAAIPLIRALRAQYPEHPFVVTTVTPTGSEQVQRVLGGEVFHVYLPYDLPAAVKRFLKRVRPRLAVVMETEIWPNLFYACREQMIPIVVANARLSERSLRGYRPVRSLAAMSLNCSTRVAAQTETDLERLLLLGGEPDIMRVVGSLKFDLDVPAELAPMGQEIRQTWGANRFVMVAGSTHEDDEVPLMQAWAQLQAIDPDALLVIAPRHPERFARVVGRCRSAGYRTGQRSVEAAATHNTQCFVVDTLGELMRYYAAADLAFVGGSLAHVGGHNVLEPAALGVPVLVGPHTFNFSEITRMLLKRGGARRVRDANELGTAIVELHSDRDALKAMGRAGSKLVLENKGALSRTLALISEAEEVEIKPLK